MSQGGTVALVFQLLLPTFAFAAGKEALHQKLDEVRMQRLSVEKDLIDSERSKKTTQDQLKRLKTLQTLQAREKTLTRQRLETLEKYVRELQGRKSEVERRIEGARVSVKRKLSKLIHPLFARGERTFRGEEGEGERRIREGILSRVAGSELKELGALYADLEDAREIETRIEQEKQQINALLQDVSEQESLIEFHRKIRENLTSERHEEQLRQLEEYRKLKVSESEIEKMISGFQERQRPEKETEAGKRIPLISFKPKSLPWPISGKIVGAYGQHRDERSGLNVFRKGIEILTVSDRAPVAAVLDGKVQFAGEIPGKGKVLILEHPHSIYTIYSGMGEVLRKSGDLVRASEKLGHLESDRSLYFEIRARNVAIDPVKWLK
jgi:septal ring factor EnvC (AmiA/AmiB activator)